MKIEGYSQLFIEQSTFISNGFYKPSDKSILRFRIVRGEGIWWTFRWHQKELSAWCEEQSWRHWVEDKIRFPEIHEVDRDLLQLAAEWSLLSISEELHQAGITVKEISAKSNLIPGWCPVLTMNQGNNKLELVLVDWPAEVLRGLVRGWKPLAAADGSAKPLLRCPVTVGRMTIPYGLLVECVPGAVIVLPTDCHMNEQIYWMMAADVLIKLTSYEEGYMVSEITTEENNEVIDARSALTSFADIDVSISFEIGSALLSVAELAVLKPGSVLKPEITSETAVNIRVNGRVFATGDFVLLEDVPGVRINKLLQG
ncbi:TPA: FliM/FliN family flagellar motor switch protein [Citrobacter werkmanii]